MTVAELIKKLETFDQDLPVYYELYSDTSPMDPEDIIVVELGQYRPGDVHFTPVSRYRDVEFTRKFKALLFPGN